MKMPTPFRVGHRRYLVKVVDNLPQHGQGMIEYEKKRVLLGRHSPIRKYTSEEQFATLIHEITHAVLHDMGSNHNKESFVEPFALRMAQALASAKFD